jgi:hypothetical protein
MSGNTCHCTVCPVSSDSCDLTCSGACPLPPVRHPSQSQVRCSSELRVDVQPHSKPPFLYAKYENTLLSRVIRCSEVLRTPNSGKFLAKILDRVLAYFLKFSYSTRCSAVHLDLFCITSHHLCAAGSTVSVGTGSQVSGLTRVTLPAPHLLYSPVAKITEF